MKKKEKDDVMGEDVSSLPEAKSMAYNQKDKANTDHYSSTMREPDMRFTASMVLSATDQKRRRASDIILQVHEM